MRQPSFKEINRNVRAEAVEAQKIGASKPANFYDVYAPVMVPKIPVTKILVKVTVERDGQTRQVTHLIKSDCLEEFLTTTVQYTDYAEEAPR